ncbi:MAG: iron chelate uptake ABC transporter family permease subunit, partial [Candidatus Delongbacteria bacterium]|nr:iron chelate uptake ABC transporter family permease subunit [Candidatus Delongbacteria bacterium]
MILSKTNKIIILFIILIVFFLMNLFLGSSIISPSDIFNSDTINEIFFKIRLPRALLALITGGVLAMSGAVFQSLFRNPIASPFTLGTASGASLGATLYIISPLSFSILGFSLVTVFSFAGAIVSILIIYLISLFLKSFKDNTMILTGVVINFFFASIILLLQYTTDPANVFKITRWTMGGLNVIGYTPIINTAIFFIVGSIIIYNYRNELNLLSIGDELSISRGVEINKVKKVLFVVTSLMIGSVVAFTGPIGFVGIIAPHIASAFVGKNYKHLLIASVLTGASMLLICDLISKVILAPAELPVGIVTAIFG